MESSTGPAKLASSSWQEALITIFVVALSVLAVWTVFGPEIDVELTHLFQPHEAPASSTEHR